LQRTVFLRLNIAAFFVGHGLLNVTWIIAKAPGGQLRSAVSPFSIVGAHVGTISETTNFG
jgi:hypothetical protein